MIPRKTIEELIVKHSSLEKELSSGEIDKKLFAEKSKEYSDINEIIDIAKKYINFENDKLELNKILEDQGNKAKMLLQIHDELIFECLKKDENQIKKIIKDSMISISSSEHHMFSIPLEVSINSGNNWGEAH